MRYSDLLPVLCMLPWCSTGPVAVIAAPSGPEEIRMLRAVQFRMKAEGDAGRRTYYADQKSFDAGRPLEGSKMRVVASLDGMDMSYFDVDEVLAKVNDHLAAKGWAHGDSTARVDDQSTAFLRIDIEEWQYRYTNNGPHQFELGVRWSLLDRMDRTTVWDTLTSGAASSGMNARGDHARTFREAILQSLDAFLVSPDLKAVLVKDDGPFGSVWREWPVLELAGPARRTMKARDAMPSVVTVVQGKDFCSGIVLSTDGHILTGSQFALADTALALEVRFQDGARSPARRVRINRMAGLALLKVDRTDLQPMAIAAPADLVAGDEVFAISTPNNLELGQSISHGILSGTRSWEGRRYLQTDVRISPGSSGGALTDPQGGLIGVLIAKWIGPSVHGLGFAVPADLIEKELKVHLPR